MYTSSHANTQLVHDRHTSPHANTHSQPMTHIQAAGFTPYTEYSLPWTMTKQKAIADQFQERANCVNQPFRHRGRPLKSKVPSTVVRLVGRCGRRRKSKVPSSVVRPVRHRGTPPKSKVPSTSHHLLLPTVLLS